MAVRVPKFAERFLPLREWAEARKLPTLGKRLAWEGGKIVALVALREVVKRVRAGPLTASIRAPLRAREGESLFVEALVESPHALTRCDAYFGGAWVSGSSLAPGLRREKWLFRAEESGLRPVVVRLADVEGHVLTHMRWVLVLPGSARRLTPSPAPSTAGRDERTSVTQDA